VPCDASASTEGTGEEIGFVDSGSSGIASKKDFRVRTASSADRPAFFRRRTSLVRLRKSFPSGFERQATSLQVWPTCSGFNRDGAPIFGNSDGHKLAAMRPVGLGQAGTAQKGDSGRAGITHKEFSSRKNWLFPRPPTNGGSRFSKKAS
jgi:hypothetical protein